MRANLLNPLQFFRQPGSALALLWIGLIWGAAVQAAEFGEAQVASFIGQPLVAEVELTALSNEESSALQVRPSGPDVYRGANIRMDPVLGSLHWVIRHRDKRQFLRITTDRPVTTPFLNMFFELGSKTERNVRALTVWLEPDPEPGTSAAPALAPASPPLAVPVPFPHTRASTAAPVASEPESHADNTAPVLTPHNLPASRSSCSASRQRCAAIDRENRIIRAQIQELEKSVIVLNETIIGSARPGSAHSKKAHDKAALSEEKTDSADQTDAAPSAMEASASAAVEGELFLKKEEEPVIVAKKPVVKKLPWTWIALGAGAGLLLLALLALWLRKRKKKAPARSSALASSTAADVAAPADADGADGAEATAAAAPAAKGWAKWWQALKQRWPGKASAGPDDAPARPGLMARMKLALAGVIGKLRKKPTTRPEAEAEPGA